VGPAQILLVEDDTQLRELVRRGLEQDGEFAVTGIGTAAEALERVDRGSPAAVIIDVGLPDADGRDLCQALRVRGVQAPVVFLTARDAVSDRLAGFSAGGDDYLTKPFSLAELEARLRALLRRAGGGGRLSTVGLTLDPMTFEIWCRTDQRLRLSPTEFRLLGALAAHSERAVSRRELVRAGWPEGAVVRDNTIDVYLARLRRKLAGIECPAEITTIRGIGYRLK
jgi:two-component system OmpR family response regulator